MHMTPIICGDCPAFGIDCDPQDTDPDSKCEPKLALEERDKRIAELTTEIENITISGFVLVDRETGEVRGGLNSIACVYTRAGAERVLQEFTRKEKRDCWLIRPAKMEVKDAQ